MPLNNKRALHIDALKIIAIYMVLFNHTGTDGFSLFINERNSLLYPFYMFIAIFIKIAVPLFFMTSGALLLDKEESYLLLIRKRFLKFSLILFTASIIEYLYMNYKFQHETLSLTTFFKVFFTDTHSDAYWYLYAYLAYILMLPLLRKLAKSMTQKDYLWLILMYSLISLMSIFEFLCWKGTAYHNSFFSFFITSDIVFYPLLGYFLEKKLFEKDFTPKRLCLMVFISFISISVCCLMTHYKCTILNEWEETSCQTFFNTLIFIPAMTVYYAFKMWFLHHKVGDKMRKIIPTLSGTVFGIFLFENIYRQETILVFFLLKPAINTLPACLIWILVACASGSFVTYLLKKIPLIKKFL